MSATELTGTPLAQRTTLRLGGPARRLVVVDTEADLVDAVRTADAAGDPVLVLGGGSNVVIADEGFDGLVVHVATRGVARSGGELTVAAGEDWDALVAGAVADGLAGIEALSGIPGLVGATPIQNVGAYGQDVAQTVTAVRVLERSTGEVLSMRPEDCRFSYRHSRFKGNDRVRRARVSRSGSTLHRRPARSAMPSWQRDSVSRSGPAPPWPTSGRPSWSCAAPRAWCSTPATTTPGARGRSSPTRS